MKSLRKFKVRLFGLFRANLNDASLTTFYSTKAQALLAYLLVEANQPHSRDFLATLLWGDQTSEKARTNLRTTFAKLRKLLTPLETDAPLFATTHQTIQLNLNPDHHWVDVVEFNNLLTGCEGKQVDIPACAEAMSRAVELYQNEFLSDLFVKDAEGFEAWRLEQQERYHVRALSLLSCLSGYYLLNTHKQLDYQLAEQYARQQLTLEPWSEMAHCQLMEVLAKTGQSAAALAQFETCRRILAEELGVEPSPETVAMAEQIRRGELSQETQTQTAPQLNWAEVPLAGIFFGRSNELAKLQQWLVEDRCRVVTILGMGGQGKTSLAAQVARAVADQFDVVAWHSLLNAPTLDELLPGVLQTLSGAPVLDYPDSLAEKLSLLLHQLRQQRCLLVLDNLETILQNEPAGQYRPGYEQYGRLIETLAQHDHQSCLLLTSREQPQSRWLMPSNLPGVQTLALSGLDLGAAHQILQAHDVRVNQAEAGQLAGRYSGNPLALNLLAQTIQDLYYGDVAAFLTEETPIFADIRDVLDKQFNRLSALEQDILLWLAVAREPMFPPDLTKALVHPVRQRELLETLRSLQQRSLLERSEAGFMLQNVVTEYLTDYFVEQAGREIEREQMNRLNSHSMLHAQAKAYVRQSQTRLILQPVAERLTTRLGMTGIDQTCRRLLDQLRQAPLAPSYAAGNLLNLLLHLGIDVTGYDFSKLDIRQAYLQGQFLPDIDFSHVNFHQSIFTDTFGASYSLAFSPDGQLLAVGTMAGEIRLWHIAELYPVTAIKGHSGAVLSVAFSPDGQMLVSGSADQSVRLWDVNSGECQHVFKEHSHTVWSVAFSPDGQMIASGSEDQTVRVWSIETNNEKLVLRGHTGPILDIAFSPDGQQLASGSDDKTVCLWDMASGEAIHILSGHTDVVRTVAFNPDGQTLASAGSDKTIRLWNPKTGTLVRLLEGHTYWIYSLAFSPDGQTLVSGGADKTVRLWDVGSGEARHIWRDFSKYILSLDISPDGLFLACTGFAREIQLWNLRTGQLQHLLQGHSIWVDCLAFSPDGRTMASASSDALVHLWDPVSGQHYHTFKGHNQSVCYLAFSPDGQTLASGSYDQTVKIWNLGSKSIYHQLKGHSDWVHCVAFSGDGKMLASGSEDLTVKLWDPSTGRLLYTLTGHTKAVTRILFSPDDSLIASCNDERIIRLWNMNVIKSAITAQTSEALPPSQILEGHQDWVYSIAFSPDGRTLASGGHDGTIRLWDLASGRTTLILREHTNWVRAVAFSPDGSVLASSGVDRTVRLWDMPTGKIRYVFHGHVGWVDFVAFSPDGRLLASGGGDGTIRVWAVDREACLHLLHMPGPYQGMDISGVTGITDAQRSALKALGAVEGD